MESLWLNKFSTIKFKQLNFSHTISYTFDKKCKLVMPLWRQFKNIDQKLYLFKYLFRKYKDRYVIYCNISYNSNSLETVKIPINIKQVK